MASSLIARAPRLRSASSPSSCAFWCVLRTTSTSSVMIAITSRSAILPGPPPSAFRRRLPIGSSSSRLGPSGASARWRLLTGRSRARFSFCSARKACSSPWSSSPSCQWGTTSSTRAAYSRERVTSYWQRMSGIDRQFAAVLAAAANATVDLGCAGVCDQLVRRLRARAPRERRSPRFRPARLPSRAMRPRARSYCSSPHATILIASWVSR